MKRIAFLTMVVLALAWVAPSGVRAGLTWEAHGSASDGRPENGRATFTFDSASNLSITLENTAGVSQLGGISSVLDGVAFTLSDNPSYMWLTGAHAAGTVTATRGIVFNDPPGGVTQTGWKPFGWTLQQESDGWFLSAGNGTFKPYGIVNHNITATDGITNNKHNPYLDGPVTFNLALAGLMDMPEIKSVELYFGTRPDIQSATPTPVPGSLLLLASGIVGFIAVRRRFVKSTVIYPPNKPQPTQEPQFSIL